VDFCNRWIYSEKKEEALLSIPDFIFYWAIVQFVITLYIAFFVPEKRSYTVDEDDDGEDEDEIEVQPSQVLPILCDILKNKNL